MFYQHELPGVHAGKYKYIDHTEGTLHPIALGKLYLSSVILRLLFFLGLPFKLAGLLAGCDGMVSICVTKDYQIFI